MKTAFLLAGVLAAHCAAALPAYTNRAGNVVCGVPIAVSPTTITLSNGVERTILPLSAFPDLERRRLTAEGGSRQAVPPAVRLAVNGLEAAIRRSQQRAARGECTHEQSTNYCARLRANLARYLDNELHQNRLLPAERALWP